MSNEQIALVAKATTSLTGKEKEAVETMLKEHLNVIKQAKVTIPVSAEAGKNFYDAVATIAYTQ